MFEIGGGVAAWLEELVEDIIYEHCRVTPAKHPNDVISLTPAMAHTVGLLLSNLIAPLSVQMLLANCNLGLPPTRTRNQKMLKLQPS